MTTTTYRPLTDEELGPGPDDYSTVRWGRAERMWEQARRANALAEAAEALKHFYPENLSPALSKALAAYFGDET